MWTSGKAIIPAIIGLTLCGVSAALLYVLLKKEDDEAETTTTTRNEATSKFIKRTKAIPKDTVAAIIGRRGSKIKEISQISGARINMSDIVENDEPRLCTIQGTPVAVNIAEGLIDEIIEQQKSMETLSMSVPHWSIGKLIGKNGENINMISQTSGAKINVSGNESTSTKNVKITGLPTQIQMAKNLIEKMVAESKIKRDVDSKRREPRGKHASPGGGVEDSLLRSDPGTKGVCPQNAPPAGSSGALLEVFVSAISSPSRFWMQIVGPQVEELDKLVDTMTEYYNNIENRNLHILSDVQIGQIVAAVFRHDGKWYRAKVLDIKPNEFDERQQVCDLYFVDYGDNEYVSKNELYSLRTDMLKLRFQAVECFIAGIAPTVDREANNLHIPSWDNQAIERFEELTQVARWKPLWSKTCTFKERPKIESNIVRNAREGSPIPGVKLYDTTDGTDVDIGQVLVDEGWAIEISDQDFKSLEPSAPSTPTNSPNLPPTFGDLECSRVLGMVPGNRDERAVSLPHGGSPRSMSPKPSSSNAIDDGKPKSVSLAMGIDDTTVKKPNSDHSAVEFSYPKVETNGFHMNGSTEKSHQNGDFLIAEREAAAVKDQVQTDQTNFPEPIVKPHPIHVPDPKDELKAKINRVESHHGSLEALGKQNPPLSIIHPAAPSTKPSQPIDRTD